MPALYQLSYLALYWRSPYFVNIFVRGRQSEVIQPHRAYRPLARDQNIHVIQCSMYFVKPNCLFFACSFHFHQRGTNTICTELTNPLFLLSKKPFASEACTPGIGPSAGFLINSITHMAQHSWDY